MPGSGAWFLFSAENAMYPGQVSWLRSAPASRCRVSAFPGFTTEWTMATHLRLQWRDRTGIAPDFPFQPSRAPWVCICCTTPGVALTADSPISKCMHVGRVPLASRKADRGYCRAGSASPMRQSETRREQPRKCRMVLLRLRVGSEKCTSDGDGLRVF